MKDQISKVNWDWLNLIKCSTNNLYEIFGNIFSGTYNVNFPFTETEMKPKNMRMPWFSKGLKKSSEAMPRLYIKFLKYNGAEVEEKKKELQKSFRNPKNKIKETLSMKEGVDSHVTFQIDPA